MKGPAKGCSLVLNIFFKNEIPMASTENNPLFFSSTRTLSKMINPNKIPI